MSTHDFATVVSVSRDGLVGSHVPVLVRPSGTSRMIVGHMARANDHWRVMDGATPALVVFHGPHGYVSPTWDATAPAVPTWNYGVVHAHGLPRVNEDEAFLRGVLEQLVQRYEGDRPDGWHPGTLPRDFYDRMLRRIVGFEMPVTKLDGKFKLGQNRSVEDRRRTIAALEKEGCRESTWLAEFMRRHSGV
ncbi:MAG: FMN-binding negative transcriptional regulator [Candidatus Binatia bacterium]